MRFGHGIEPNRAFLGAKGRLKHKSQVCDNPLCGVIRGSYRGENALGLQLPEGVVEDVPQEFTRKEGGACGEMRDNCRAEDYLKPGRGQHNAIGNGGD